MAYNFKSFAVQFVGLISAAVLLCMACGCDEYRQSALNHVTRNAAERKYRVELAVENALKEHENTDLTVWLEFRNHWTNSFRRIGFSWHESDHAFKGNVVRTAVIEKRYVLRIMIGFQLQADYSNVMFSDPRFHLFEIERVSFASGEVGHIKLNPDQKWFGLGEWKALSDSKFDFSVIGINIQSNSPVPHIESAVKTL